MQCLNVTTELTSFYLNDENYKKGEILENPQIQPQEAELLKNNKKKSETLKVNSKNVFTILNLRKPIIVQKPVNKPPFMNINETFRKFLKETREANPKLYDPSELYNKMGSLYSQFRGHSQQDAQEFLRFFLGKSD